MDTDGNEMTLAFSLAALKHLDDPQQAFDDATEWSNYVGVVSDQPQHVVMKYTRDRRLPTNFLSRPSGEKRRSLEDAKNVSPRTDRYVFVGTTEQDNQIAQETDWEYIPIENAADAAGWQIRSQIEETDSTPVIETDKRDDWP